MNGSTGAGAKQPTLMTRDGCVWCVRSAMLRIFLAPRQPIILQRHNSPRQWHFFHACRVIILNSSIATPRTAPHLPCRPTSKWRFTLLSAYALSNEKTGGLPFPAVCSLLNLHINFRPSRSNSSECHAMEQPVDWCANCSAPTPATTTYRQLCPRVLCLRHDARGSSKSPRVAVLGAR